MTLPKLRHVEFLILKTIQRGPKRRGEIQKALKWANSNDNFYKQMTTLEFKGMIRKEWRVVEKPFRYFLQYEITMKGLNAIQESHQFYSL